MTATHLVAATHPFKVATIDRVVPDGITLGEMVEMLDLDSVAVAHAHVHIGDQYIPRDLWRVVRPKAGTTITLRVWPQGGGGGGGKSPLRIILMIAVIAASFFLGPMLGAAIGSAFGATSASAVAFAGLSYATLGSALIAVAGGMLINA